MTTPKAIRRDGFRFTEPLRVRWAEVDGQQVVFNGHYLMYFDTAMAGYWRRLGLPYAQTLADLGGDLFVRKAMLEYHAPARYDDALEVGLRFDGVGRSSLRFVAAVFHEHRLLVGGELLYVWVDAAARTPRPVPAAFAEVLRAFEAGAAPWWVETGAWAALQTRAQPVRTAVFVDEQGIPAALEWDAADAQAVHAIAVNRLGGTLATGRLLPAVAGRGRIGRMAVLRSQRGSGVGRAVLEALVDAARRRGDAAVELHAQVSAEAFYLRAGFVADGPRFDEAGIAHQAMWRAT